MPRNEPPENRRAGEPGNGTPSEDTAGAEPIVAGVGASAGGLAALRELLAGLSSAGGLALVVVTHRNPDVRGHLEELLDRATPLEVTQVEESCEIEASHLYIPPPGQLIEITDGRLIIRRGESHRSPKRPIDHFFRSLADSGSAAIAVVLSGANADGAAGAREIKAAGGIVLVQEPSSAQHDRMPRAAIATGAADLVLPPAAIGKELDRLSRHPLVRSRLVGPAVDDEAPAEPAPADAPVLSEEQLEAALRLLLEEVGVDFFNYKRTTIRRRTHRRMALRQVVSADRYLELLREDPEERRQLYRDLLIHVTRFFREPEAFAALAESVFPRLLSDRPEGDPLRIWIPGCASGEEAYSVAITLLEHVGRRDHGQPFQIFGTDLSDRSIEVARAGVYPRSIEAEVSPQRLERFFTPLDGGYRIARWVRELCVFARQDLVRDPPFSNLDLVVCRNVLIYLDAELQERLRRIFHYALKPGGFLLLGAAETVGAASRLFDLVDKEQRLYQRRETGRRELPPSLAAHARAVAEPGRSPRPRRPRSTLADRFDQALAERFAPASVLIDADGHVLHTRGATGSFLALPHGEASLDLFRMIRGGLLHALRAAFHQARERSMPVRRRGRWVESDRGGGPVDVEVVPLTDSAEPHLYVVVFHAVEPGDPEADVDPSEPREEAADEESRLAQLERELAASQRFLRSTVEDLEASNEELQAANEEILSANEELQSTNEELETAKEELQSTNEELQTLNQELLERNRELRRANSDMKNLLASVEIAIVMVDRELRIWRFTSRAEKALNLLESDVGRPIGHLRSSFDLPDLESLLGDAIERVAYHEREVRDRDGRWHWLRIRPYKSVDDRIDGAVLSLVDIDTVKRHQLEMQKAHDYAEAILATVAQPIVVLDRELRVDRANRAFQETYGSGGGAVEGKRLDRLIPPLFEVEGLREAIAAALAEDRPIESREVEVEPAGERPTILRLDARKLAGVGETEPDLLLLVIEDVTAARLAERERLAAEEERRGLEVERLRVKERSARARSEAKDRFLAVLSHELRTPMTPIAAAADRLAEDPELPVSMREAVERIQRNARIEARLIDDLLDVSSIERGLMRLRTETVDVHRVIEAVAEICTDVARAADVSVELELEAAEHHAAGDPIRLQQVFWNLLHNAVKFSSAGGRVTIASDNPGPGVLLVTVADGGMGMTPGELEQLFQPFVRPEANRRHGGLGLGLSISRGLIEAHGGSIFASSAGPGEGTVMRVELPTIDPDAEPAEAAESALGAEPFRRTAPLRLLLVEDDADSGAGLAELLELKGFEVRVEGSLAAASAALSEGPVPDLVISDLQLPDGSGLELAARLNDAGVSVPAITLSGFGSPDDREASAKAGFVRHLTKPIDVRDLLAAIDEVVG